MALAINAGPDVKRSDLFFVDPYQVVLKEELRGRFRAPDEAAIIDMAESMFDHSQLQPVQCRRMADNKLQINLGFTRTAAARLIREGFTGKDGVERKDPEFKLKVVVSETNDKKAFINNVVENAKRNETSPIDDAYNHNILRERYGYTDSDISRLYCYSDTNKVSRLRRLLTLPENLQFMVHSGKMTVTAALEILDLPEADRASVIEQATTETGKVDGGAVRAQVRDHHLRDDEDGTPPEREVQGDSARPRCEVASSANKPAKIKARTVKEIRVFVEGQLDKLGEPEDGEADSNKEARDFLGTLLLFIQGKRNDKSMAKALAAVFG